MEENVTLIGYNSKKQPYIGLVASILTFLTAILFAFFAKGNDKFAAILIFFIAIGFLFAFFDSLKQPNIGLKIVDDKYIIFYSREGEKIIKINEITKIHYWPGSFGLEIVIYTIYEREYFAYMLSNIKEVKKYLLCLFKKENIPVVKIYSK